MIRLRIEHTIDSFHHELAQLTPLLERALSGNEPCINREVPPAVITQQEIMWLHSRYISVLNTDDVASEESNLPRNLGTGDGEHFFHAKVMIIRRSEAYCRDVKPQELLKLAFDSVRQFYENLASGIPHPHGVEIGQRYDVWLWALGGHKDKWVRNWSGASRWIMPEDWDVAKAFDEEIERITMERAEEVGKASSDPKTRYNCRMQ